MIFNVVYTCIVNTLEGPEEAKHSLSGYLLKIKDLNLIELNSIHVLNVQYNMSKPDPSGTKFSDRFRQESRLESSNIFS